MSEPTLTQVFGAGATQSATDLTIRKADLAAVGLTASATNTPESLIVAILLMGGVYLNDTTQETNPDIQVSITQDSTQRLVVRNSANYREATFSISLQTADPTFTIDPDNY